VTPPEHRYAEIVDVDDLRRTDHVTHEIRVGGEVCREIGFARAEQPLDHSADRGEIELPERHRHSSEDIVVSVFGATEGLFQSLLEADVGTRFNDLVRSLQSARQPYRRDNAVGRAALYVALPSAGLSKALLDQRPRFASGLEQVVYLSAQGVRLTPAINLLGSRVPPGDAAVSVANHEAFANEVKNLDAHFRKPRRSRHKLIVSWTRDIVALRSDSDNLCLPQTSKQGIGVERFPQHANSAASGRLGEKARLRSACDENNGRGIAALVQSAFEVDAGKSRHMDVGDNAATGMSRSDQQKLLR
jgi:hypothetical protein